MLALSLAVTAVLATVQRADADIDTCGDDRWLVPVVTVKVHTGGFHGTSTQQTRMIDAINDVNDEFNRIGGSQAYASPAQITTAPFDYDNGGDDSQTIHVGFADDLPEPEGFTGGATGSTHLIEWQSDCQLLRTVTIGFLDEHIHDWNYGTPQGDGDAGTAYYDTGKWDESDVAYFRISYLHELLHAFGLDHSADTYDFMNYGERPWANRTGPHSIRPLPADIRKLCSLYPLGTTRTEVAVLNTWYDPADVTAGAASQRMLCKPSQGEDWATSLFAEECGTGGPEGGDTEVCEGDALLARFALANYSTSSVDVTARLWLSLDDQWDATDLLSPTTREFTVDAASSYQSGNTWSMPVIGQAQLTGYHVIVRVVATTPSGATAGDWIPLRGKVGSDCPFQQPDPAAPPEPPFGGK